jgi:hypothetical protein
MRKSVPSGLWAAMMVLTIAPPLLAAGVADAPSRGHFIRMDAKAVARTSGLGLNPKLAIDYGLFKLVELDDADLARLKASGAEYVDPSDDYSLVLGEVRFDPLRELPSVPAGWEASTARAVGKDLRLIQFVGPTKQEWLDRLKDDGLEIIQYIHPCTFVVFGESATASNQRAVAETRWTGDFLPAYKVLPRWRALAAQAIATKVIVYRGADANHVFETVTSLGGKLDSRSNTDPAFDVATFQLPGDKLIDVAALPGVYSIQPIPTDGGLRGEMSDQINVNNVDGSGHAFPGYLAWLSSVGLSGAGVRIANVDGGVQETHPNLVNRFVTCTGVTCSSSSSTHGTHTAGIMAADGTSGVLDSYGFQRGLGVAPGANLIEQLYNPWFTQPNGMLMLMTDSYNNGASISGNSWGPAGSPQGYDDDTRQVDVGVRDASPAASGNQPLTYVLSIMNGYGAVSSQGTPDEAKNIFAIGSTKMQTSGGTQMLEINDISTNSAHGPALDGRKLPHMVAPGCYVDSTYPTNSYSRSAAPAWPRRKFPAAPPYSSSASAAYRDTRPIPAPL